MERHNVRQTGVYTMKSVPGINLYKSKSGSGKTTNFDAVMKALHDHPLRGLTASKNGSYQIILQYRGNNLRVSNKSNLMLLNGVQATQRTFGCRTNRTNFQLSSYPDMTFLHSNGKKRTSMLCEAYISDYEHVEKFSKSLNEHITENRSDVKVQSAVCENLWNQLNQQDQISWKTVKVFDNVDSNILEYTNVIEHEKNMKRALLEQITRIKIKLNENEQIKKLKTSENSVLFHQPKNTLTSLIHVYNLFCSADEKTQKLIVSKGNSFREYIAEMDETLQEINKLEIEIQLLIQKIGSFLPSYDTCKEWLDSAKKKDRICPHCNKGTINFDHLQHEAIHIWELKSSILSKFSFKIKCTRILPCMHSLYQDSEKIQLMLNVQLLQNAVQSKNLLETRQIKIPSIQRNIFNCLKDVPDSFIELFEIIQKQPKNVVTFLQSHKPSSGASELELSSIETRVEESIFKLQQFENEKQDWIVKKKINQFILQTRQNYTKAIYNLDCISTVAEIYKLFQKENINNIITSMNTIIYNLVPQFFPGQKITLAYSFNDDTNELDVISAQNGNIRPVTTFSTGEQRRFVILQTIAFNLVLPYQESLICPNVMFLDEILDNIDIETCISILTCLRTNLPPLSHICIVHHGLSPSEFNFDHVVNC